MKHFDRKNTFFLLFSIKKAYGREIPHTLENLMVKSCGKQVRKCVGITGRQFHF